MIAPYEVTFVRAVPPGAKAALIYGSRGNVYASKVVTGGRWGKVYPGTFTYYFGRHMWRNRAVLDVRWVPTTTGVTLKGLTALVVGLTVLMSPFRPTMTRSPLGNTLPPK